MKTPVIAIEASPLARGTLGIGTYVGGLLQGLQQLLEDRSIDARFQLVYFNPQKEVPPVPGPAFENRVVRVPRRLLNHLWLRAHLLPLDRFLGCDVFHGTGHILPYTRCPSVLTMHDVSWEAFPHSFSAKQLQFNRRWVGLSLKQAQRSGGAVIADSHFSAQEVENAFGLSATQQHVVSLGVDPARFVAATTAQVTQTRQWLGMTDDRPYVLCIGLVEHRKNLEGSIAAWEEARRLGSTARLVIAGKDGEGADAVRQRARESMYAVDILMTGFVPTEHVAGLYGGCTAVSFLSHYEGFGLPVLEAMAVGVPVLVSDCASLPEVWGNGNAGLEPLIFARQNVSQAGAALFRLERDADYRSRCIAYGADRIAQFTWRRCAERTWDVYRRAICL